MGLAFLVAFPAGALLVRSIQSKSMMKIHATYQLSMYLICLAGLSLGLYLAIQQDKLSNPHAIFGLIIILLFLPAQAALGYVHHYYYKKKSRGSSWTNVHIQYGRISITSGLINAFLGLRLSGQPVGIQVAYTILALFVWSAWVIAVVLRDGNGGRRGKPRSPPWPLIGNAFGRPGSQVPA
ncbi:MAG: hypothetical protein OHK93_004660 [Ramalina farinacea]|uniref:Cytochrome b561 domain-containing protein n=1 Tax=Ramalina farinacea TaxID=258253 RepID=A0AA43QV58_9LECA|nr:hypothetical protein [Ramalina farinacea]